MLSYGHSTPGGAKVKGVDCVSMRDTGKDCMGVGEGIVGVESGGDCLGEWGESVYMSEHSATCCNSSENKMVAGPSPSRLFKQEKMRYKENEDSLKMVSAGFSVEGGSSEYWTIALLMQSNHSQARKQPSALCALVSLSVKWE